MKKYTFMLGITLVLVANVGCKSSKINQSAMQNETTKLTKTEKIRPAVAPEDSGHEPIDNDNTTNLVQGYNGSTGSNISVNSESLEVPISTKEDFTIMYKELKMSENQINQFEKAIKDFEKRQRNKPNGEMLGTVASERQRQLKQILSPEQYTSYEKWKKNRQ
ncbi:hypothetical protein KCTC52924_03429 [Arenibacter antarcticus]|uniref:Lipoprotein n=1 Tax=Arenibacter antarcticus TaxID=2040469 RepID=A0ABW5VHX9_9FLAO|nr:hypothetical protein [Arenibacter sp. H213]MCM4166496.1 hypothetical protein [Arenibacter sp. H213]